MRKTAAIRFYLILWTFVVAMGCQTSDAGSPDLVSDVPDDSQKVDGLDDIPDTTPSDIPGLDAFLDAVEVDELDFIPPLDIAEDMTIPPEDIVSEDVTTEDQLPEVTEPEPTFSFAIVADPHLNGNPDRRENLLRAVNQIIAEQDAFQIELVFILGDIAWGEVDGLSNVADAKSILDAIEDAGMHYIPVMGDNEAQYGGEEEFHSVFASQYEHLAENLDGWVKMPMPAGGLFLENFSFEHKGCHFVSADFIARVGGTEACDIHDFEGGSWPWLLADIAAASQGPLERINVFTHHGMFRTSIPAIDNLLISVSDMDKIIAGLCPYRDYVATSYGGHVHQNWPWETPCTTGEVIYQVWMTDDAFDAVVSPETDDDRVTIRVVTVTPTESLFTYEQTILEEPVSNLDATD